MQQYYHKLGSYQLMIASKYFESITDFKNLEYATKKARGNMEKFHFNPIALTEETIHFFAQLETLHVYNEGDKEFRERKFYRRIIHYALDYSDYMRRTQSEEDVYLNLVFDKESANTMNEIPSSPSCISVLKGEYKNKRMSVAWQVQL